MNEEFTILSGTANRPLAQAIGEELGAPLADCTIQRFPDGEVMVDLGESVRRKDVFIVQPTAPPVDSHLVELLALVDACRRAAAASITAIVPYFGYARADKRQGRRQPITARMVADLLETVGVSQIITVDLHAAQIEGFFHIPVDDLTAAPVLWHALEDQVPADAVVVSPDVGRVGMAMEYAAQFGARVAVLHKVRESATATAITHIVGDVRDRPCLIIDDMISTGGTIANAVEALLAAGARPEFIVAATHGLLLEGARERLMHPAIQAVYVTDTAGVPDRAATPPWLQLRVVSVAPLLSRAITRILSNRSLHDLR